MIPLFKPALEQVDEDQLVAVLQSGKIACGPYSDQFALDLSHRIGNSNFVTTNSHTSAVLLALKVLGLKPGDVVLASPLSCLATTAPVQAQGMDVRWVDIDPVRMCLDAADVARAIKAYAPRAILAYHWCGIPSVTESIRRLASDTSVLLIEDASEAFGAVTAGGQIGATGADAVLFSFNPVRHVTALDGGGVAFKDKALYLSALRLRDHGIDRSTFRSSDGEISPDSDIPVAGYGFALNNVNSFVGLHSLSEFDQALKRRRDICDAYTKGIAVIPAYEPLDVAKGDTPAFWTYTFLSDHRDALMAFLHLHGVSASKVHIRNDIYSCFKTEPRDLPGVDMFSRRGISIPCGPWLSDGDVSGILSLLREFAHDH